MFARLRSCYRAAIITLLFATSLAASSAAQAPSSATQERSLVSCKPAAERTGTEGCWIIASKPLGKLSSAPVFWTLDVYPSRSAAEKAITPSGTVVEALGKVWLLTVGERLAPSATGTRITQIGPLPIHPDSAYTAQFSEGILAPGAVSRTHTHTGPEAFYTEAGQACLETPAGKEIGRKSHDIFVPEGTPMELVSTGTETRRGLVLVLHASEKPPTTVVTDWKSKGLCSVTP